MRDMIALAARFETTAQLHKGHVGRVGDARRRRDWYSIQEWIPERLLDDDATFEHTPRGF